MRSLAGAVSARWVARRARLSPTAVGRSLVRRRGHELAVASGCDELTRVWHVERDRERRRRSHGCAAVWPALSLLHLLGAIHEQHGRHRLGSQDACGGRCHLPRWLSKRHALRREFDRAHECHGQGPCRGPYLHRHVQDQRHQPCRSRWTRRLWGPVISINSDGASVGAVGIISGTTNPGSAPCRGVQGWQCSTATIASPVILYFHQYPNSYLP